MPDYKEMYLELLIGNAVFSYFKRKVEVSMSAEPDYKKMYFELLIGMEKTISVLKEAMLQAEEIYIETAEDETDEI